MMSRSTLIPSPAVPQAIVERPGDNPLADHHRLSSPGPRLGLLRLNWLAALNHRIGQLEKPQSSARNDRL